MSHLAEEYAKSCGVKIGKPTLKPHYFPILHDRYITIHNDKKVQAKHYDLWPDVVQILKPYLNDIKIDGGTCWPQQNFVSIHRKGDLYIWPAGWTHSHYGIPAPKESKYFMSGWCSLNR